MVWILVDVCDGKREAIWCFMSIVKKLEVSAYIVKNRI
jgi:hypothetical protein